MRGGAAYRVYLAVKHFGHSPFEVWHCYDKAVRPLRPSRVRSFVLGCGLAANEEEIAKLKAMAGANPDV